MQVKLKNIADAQQVFYDINAVQRTIRPGQEITVEITQVAARKYEAAEKKPKPVMSITLVDDYDPAVDAKEKAVVLPTEDKPGPSVHNRALPREDHTFTVRESMGGDQPRTRREAEDDGPGPVERAAESREAAEEAERLGHKDGDGPAPDEPDEGGKVERVRIKPDRIAATARNKAKDKPAPEKPKGSPMTAGELLTIMDDLEPGKIIEYANKVLPKGKLPQRPKLSQVTAALRAQSLADGKKLRPDADAH